MAGTSSRIAVVVEVSAKKAFASALEWPGWCRAGRGEQAALAALAEYAVRYAPVARLAGVSFPPERHFPAATVVDVSKFDVVERLAGDTTTDFGAPGQIAQADHASLTAAAAKRQTALVAAAWSYFDQTVAAAPQFLRRGPRGGGRDRDAMVEHVLAAEASYARKLGVRHKPTAIDDTDEIEQLREEIAAVLATPSDGGLLTPTGWPPRYAARRIAWHVLDHAWEMQDRTT